MRCMGVTTLAHNRKPGMAEDAYDKLMEFLWGTWDTAELAHKVQELFPHIPQCCTPDIAQAVAELHFGGSYDVNDVVDTMWQFVPTK